MIKAKYLEIMFLTAAIVTAIFGAWEATFWLSILFAGLLGSHLAWLGGIATGRDQKVNIK